MIPAFLLEKVMCLLALSSMYEIWILRRALAAPEAVRDFLPPPSAEHRVEREQMSALALVPGGSYPALASRELETAGTGAETQLTIIVVVVFPIVVRIKLDGVVEASLLVLRHESSSTYTPGTE